MASARQTALRRILGATEHPYEMSDAIDARVSGARTVMTFSATPAFDGTDNRATWDLTLTGNITPTLTNITDGYEYSIFLQQDGTGSRTVTWPAGWKWPAATPVVLTTAANAVDLILLKVRGSTVYARGFKGFA